MGGVLTGIFVRMWHIKASAACMVANQPEGSVPCPSASGAQTLLEVRMRLMLSERTQYTTADTMRRLLDTLERNRRPEGEGEGEDGG